MISHTFKRIWKCINTLHAWILEVIEARDTLSRVAMRFDFLGIHIACAAERARCAPW